MTTKYIDIYKLEDLDNFRSAPQLNKNQSEILFNELCNTRSHWQWNLWMISMMPTKHIGTKQSQMTVNAKYRL